MDIKLPKGFRLISKGLPRLGRNIIILKKDGSSHRAFRTETCFYPEGFCFEDIHYRDHRLKDIIAWKDGRK